MRSIITDLNASVGASGPHGFAVRNIVVRRAPLARPTLPRPPHPVPNVRDDRDTPLSRDGMAGDMEVIWVKREVEYFSRAGWTRDCQRANHLQRVARISEATCGNQMKDAHGDITSLMRVKLA